VGLALLPRLAPRTKVPAPVTRLPALNVTSVVTPSTTPLRSRVPPIVRGWLSGS
jgi:hypothetical protein